MKYLVLIYSSPQTWNSMTQEERDTVVREHVALEQELIESGEYLGGNALADEAQGKMIKYADGKPIVTDGPFIGVKEHLAGYDVIECATPERALEVALRNPHARLDGIELRPIMDLGGTEMCG